LAGFENGGGLICWLLGSTRIGLLTAVGLDVKEPRNREHDAVLNVVGIWCGAIWNPFALGRQTRGASGIHTDGIVVHKEKRFREAAHGTAISVFGRCQPTLFYFWTAHAWRGYNADQYRHEIAG
jgi:hypothetical protein